jgi:hypothetical protein
LAGAGKKFSVGTLLGDRAELEHDNPIGPSD